MGNETARGATGKLMISIGDEVQSENQMSEEDRQHTEQEKETLQLRADLEKEKLKLKRQLVLENPVWVALNTRVLIMPHLPEEKTQSGIILVGKEPPEQGIVVALGSLVEDLEIGQEVLYSKWSGGTTFIDGIEMIFVNAKDIIAKKVKEREPNKQPFQPQTGEEARQGSPPREIRDAEAGDSSAS